MIKQQRYKQVSVFVYGKLQKTEKIYLGEKKRDVLLDMSLECFYKKTEKNTLFFSS